MKKITSFLLLLITFVLFISCGKKIVYDEKVTFPDCNWMFENKIITFEAPMKKSEHPHAIILELEIVGTPNVDQIYAVFSIVTPTGGESSKWLLFHFLSPQEPYIKGATDNEKIYRLVAYPKKYFSENGTYKFIVEQCSNKADNYGIRVLRLYVERGKAEKKKEE
jgi:hypothetical protein